MSTKLPISGTLNAKPNPIYIPNDGQKGLITNIRFTNPVEEIYTVSLWIKTSNNLVNVLLYKITVSAGGYINDDTEYQIPPKAMLIASCDKITATFTINGSETPA